MTNVCPHCFGEPELKRRIIEIRPKFPNRKCSFHPRYKGVPIKAVAEIIDPVFRSHYYIGEYNPYVGEQDGDLLHLAIGELVEVVDDEIAEALTQQLMEDDDYWPPDGGEPFYEDHQNYVRHKFDEYLPPDGAEPLYDDDWNYTPYASEDYHHSILWQSFCDSIVYAQRFFNTDARELISELFDEIHFQRDHHKQSPIYEVKPGEAKSTFHRARLAHEDRKIDEIQEDPARKLGPPPKRQRRAGRMNSAGVSCFYGAFDLETCIAELRPAVGLTVVGARFELIRPIWVLDTTLFAAPMKSISIFSKNHMSRVQQWRFMRNFMHEIAKPVLPSDEHLDYIPTQAVAEYLLHHHRLKRRDRSVRIEGIVYRSAQYRGGMNIVLLGDAAQVKTSDTNNKRKPKSGGFSEVFSEPVATFMSERSLPNNPGLQVVDKSLQIRRVTSAQYDSSAQRRYSFEPGDLDF